MKKSASPTDVASPDEIEIVEEAEAKQLENFRNEQIFQARQHEQLRSKIDKLFEIPLMISICMLAMAHGSNEINVAAPLAAQMFLMDPS